jgi:hypothetical protein
MSCFGQKPQCLMVKRRGFDCVMDGYERRAQAILWLTHLEPPAVAGPSMEAVVERENLKKALARMKRNKGAAGADGMAVEEVSAHL